MLQIVDIATVKSFRKFTLTSGYDNINTKFVRVSDGYSVGADPLKIKKGDRLATHHICGEGYLYACRKGYVMATEKGGYQGWTDVVEIATDTYKCFNPFEGRTLELLVSNNTLTIHDGKNKSITHIGKYATIFGEKEVYATPFKGLRNFMRLLFKAPSWGTSDFDGYYYNSDFTLRASAQGVEAISDFSPLKMWQEKYPDMKLPVATDKITRVYLGNSRTQKQTYVSVSFGVWSATFTQHDGVFEEYSKGFELSYDNHILDAYALGLIHKPSQEVYEKAKRIAIRQFALQPKPRMEYIPYEDHKVVRSLKRIMYLFKVTGTLLVNSKSTCEYRGVKYKGCDKPMLDMTYNQALAYYNTHCVKLETPFQRGYIYEGYGYGKEYKFITPAMEEWTKLDKSGVADSRHANPSRPFTQKELNNGVWVALSYYHHSSEFTHKAVEESVAYSSSQYQFEMGNKSRLESFVQTITKWFGAKDYVEFAKNGGSLRDFATINGLFKKADDAIANTGEESPIFWSPNSSYPVWAIVDGNLVVSGLINTKRGFYKTGTYFHYHRPTFKVAFNTSLEVIEAAVTE